MNGRIIKTIAELDALPEGSVIYGTDLARCVVVALKPRADDYPDHVTRIWETIGSESAMSIESLMILCREWVVLTEPGACGATPI